MVLGRDALIKALDAGDISLQQAVTTESGNVEYENVFPVSKAKRQAWIDQYVQPASIDIPIGRYIYAIPPHLDPPGSQSKMTVHARRDIRTDYPAIDQFTLFDLHGRRDGLAIIPGSMVLAHTEHFLGLSHNIACQVATRSTARRWGLDVCGSAGWVDPGFNSRITLEIVNTQPRPIYIREGVCYAQLIFMSVEIGENAYVYDGHYNLEGRVWTPQMMLPKEL